MEPAKKKRRQNVACDPCRLRRVKCDILTLLGTDASSLPSALRDRPTECTNCVSKGIRCATEGIATPRRGKKGGRRIDAARRAFGATPSDIGGSAGLGSGLGLGLGPPSAPQSQSQSIQAQSHSGSSSETTSPPQDALSLSLPLAWLGPALTWELPHPPAWDLAPEQHTAPWLFPQFSRAEALGTSLSSQAVGRELSRHLVRVYFNSVHLVLPTLSPEGFYADWTRAGERGDRMARDQAALCAVIEAWAARFSDHPAILGLEVDRAAEAPKVITRDGLFKPGGSGRSHWGRARERVCSALLERARELIDKHRILTRPSVTGVQALALYNQLRAIPSHPDSAEEEIEKRMEHTILIEQLRVLELNWNSAEAIPTDRDAAPTSIALTRVKQRRLFWTVVVADAFWAAGTGSEPKVADADIEASGEWLVAVEDALPPSAFKALSFFMAGYHRCAVLGRLVARKITVPTRKRLGAVDVTEFCHRTRAVWREIRNFYKDLNERGPDVLATNGEDLLGFSPIHHLASIRSSCAFLLLVIHQAVAELKAFRATLASVFEADADPHLADLHAQSVDATLSLFRAQSTMFHKLVPTGLLQSGSLMLRMLLGSAQFLAEIPTNEQGYPSDTPGGAGWTWAAKQREIAHCVEALHQLGWAWPDAKDVIDALALVMERMTPTAEQLAFVPPTTRHPQQDRDMERDARALDAALRFWPPVSVPLAISQWSRARIMAGVFPALEPKPGEIEGSEGTDSFTSSATDTPASAPVVEQWSYSHVNELVRDRAHDTDPAESPMHAQAHATPSTPRMPAFAENPIAGQIPLAQNIDISALTDMTADMPDFASLLDELVAGGFAVAQQPTHQPL